MSNRYNTRAAMLAMAATIVAGKTPDVRAALAEHSDIPEDRLDFATSEMQQVMFGLTQLVRFFVMVADDEDQLREMIEDLVCEATWIDDTKGELTVAVEVKGDNDETLAEASVKTKLPSEA